MSKRLAATRRLMDYLAHDYPPDDALDILTRFSGRYLRYFRAVCLKYGHSPKVFAMIRLVIRARRRRRLGLGD